MKKFADAIWKRRKDLRLSRDQVADECKVSSQTLYKWENNATSPDADEIVRLSKALKCSVASMFGESRLPKEVLSDPVGVLEAVKALRMTGHLLLEDVVAAAMDGESESKTRQKK